MKHILLYEPNREEISHTIFILKLADISCAVTGTIEEAYNWLSIDQQKQVKFDLFLLGSLNGDDLEEKLLAKITEFTLLPILYIKQDVSPISKNLNDKIVVCQPHNLLNCLVGCFNPDTSD